MVKCRVFFAVRTEFLSIDCKSFGFKGLMLKKETPTAMFFKNEYWEDYKAVDIAMQRN
jgi:hypothetical protein